MIRILLVDDDPKKVGLVRAVVDSTLRAAESELRVAASVASAWRLLREEQFNLVIIDLNVPTRSDASPARDGGARLLRRLSHPRAINVPEHILGLTEHEDLHSQFAEEFGAESWHIIHFSWISDEWEEPIRKKLLHIAEGNDRRERGYETDLAIVTALHRVELEAILALEGQWEAKPLDGDPTVYHHGRFCRGGVSIRVVAAAAPEMGMAAAASIASKMIYRWKPRYLAMAGIAAGVGGEFGDIVVADRAWDCGSGKIKARRGGRRTRFQPAPSQVPIEQGIRAKLAHFLLNGDVIDRIRKEWGGRRVPSQLRAQMGPIASGAAVVSARGVIEKLVRQHRKLLAVEMEAYGVFLAAQLACEPRPCAFAVKSICDFGDRRKGDAYQKYAAFTSARFLQEFALDQLGVPGAPEATDVRDVATES